MYWNKTIWNCEFSEFSAPKKATGDGNANLITQLIADGISHFSLRFFSCFFFNVKIHLTRLFSAAIIAEHRRQLLKKMRKEKYKTTAATTKLKEWRNSKIESKTCATINLIQEGNCFFFFLFVFKRMTTERKIAYNEAKNNRSNWKWYAWEGE